MNNTVSWYGAAKELYIGCECMDLCHVAHFVHFPPLPEKHKNKEEDKEEEVIYYNVQTTSYLNRIIPPLRYFYDIHDWKSYFSNCWLRRVGIACKYIFNSNYKRKWGVIDCFDFQKKDLPAIDDFLSLISNDVNFNINQQSECWIDNEKWLIQFSIDRMEFEDKPFPWELGWNIQFKHRKFFSKICYAFKYIFGIYSDQQCFEIHKTDAIKIKNMIKWIQKNNNQNDDKEKNEE